ncbi:hypothetical protein D3C85_1692880 [compost metagenome]
MAPFRQETGGYGRDAGQGPGVYLAPVVVVELLGMQRFVPQGLGEDARENAPCSLGVMGQLGGSDKGGEYADASVRR